MTITVAERPRLLELLREANFTSIFVGIESPRIDSLMESKKRQNAHRPLLDSVRLIQSHNLMIVAGMIVGFDHDDHRIFEEQFDFLMEAGIPFTTCGVLTAIEKTPLHARLQKEGRLLPYDSADGARARRCRPQLHPEAHDGGRGAARLQLAHPVALPVRQLRRAGDPGFPAASSQRWERETQAAGRFDWDMTQDRASRSCGTSC